MLWTSYFYYKSRTRFCCESRSCYFNNSSTHSPTPPPATTRSTYFNRWFPQLGKSCWNFTRLNFIKFLLKIFNRFAVRDCVKRVFSYKILIKKLSLLGVKFKLFKHLRIGSLGSFFYYSECEISLGCRNFMFDFCD